MGIVNRQLAEGVRGIMLSSKLGQMGNCLGCSKPQCKGDNAKCRGIAFACVLAGTILLIAFVVLVFYTLGIFHNKSLGTIFAEIRDGFRSSKPKLQ
ncbi:hypothetical protein BBBOND_0200110 [Babesia bigemina]|uniref:Uncharacterized protein n=1 Tax=Babesia bigemina TaxID=5866 RepID=A0A061D7J4_BABBI|nr:hypothetical protein BBBOND_0200110 [Babesia bigemina]CDR94854.1 hypothetical protein BBBOND_0200110 [Babesia bigemina]|eukprot:XP_012767040.1 hypothetical protein BBBOND_0200110 [Babesia bigemina]